MGLESDDRCQPTQDTGLRPSGRLSLAPYGGRGPSRAARSVLALGRRPVLRPSRPLMLRENSCGSRTPFTRLTPRDGASRRSAWPEDLSAEDACRRSARTAALVVSPGPQGGLESRYHPGWLLCSHGWFDEDGCEEDAIRPIARPLATRPISAQPPTFDGPQVLRGRPESHASLVARTLRAYRSWLAFLACKSARGSSWSGSSPRIGPVRETNFGRHYRAGSIKADPDSSAFTTSDALLAARRPADPRDARTASSSCSATPTRAQRR